jgi:hypothetical protein
LVELYALQPEDVLWNHAKRLSAEARVLGRAAVLCDLELRSRHGGLENAPDGFDEWQEDVGALSDENIQAIIDFSADRFLTLTAHWALARRDWHTPFARVMRGQFDA